MGRQGVALGLVAVLAMLVPAGAWAKVTFDVGRPRAYMKANHSASYAPHERDCYLAVPLSWRTSPDFFGGYEHVFDLAPRFPLDYDGGKWFAGFSGGMEPRGRIEGERFLFAYRNRLLVGRRHKIMRFLAHRRWIRLTSKTRVTEHGKWRRISHRYSASALSHCRLES